MRKFVLITFETCAVVVLDCLKSDPTVSLVVCDNDVVKDVNKYVEEAYATSWRVPPRVIVYGTTEQQDERSGGGVTSVRQLLARWIEKRTPFKYSRRGIGALPAPILKP